MSNIVKFGGGAMPPELIHCSSQNGNTSNWASSKSYTFTKNYSKVIVMGVALGNGGGYNGTGFSSFSLSPTPDETLYNFNWRGVYLETQEKWSHRPNSNVRIGVYNNVSSGTSVSVNCSLTGNTTASSGLFLMILGYE